MVLPSPSPVAVQLLCPNSQGHAMKAVQSFLASLLSVFRELAHCEQAAASIP